jgi:hypothetical protein
MKKNKLLGFGDAQAKLMVCIGNRPDVESCRTMTGVQPIIKDQLASIVAETGNHWRKIFNIYAKLLHQLENTSFATWQDYRDEKLLMKNCGHAMIFSDVISCREKTSGTIIVSGKTYAEAQGVMEGCVQIDESFYLNKAQKIIVAPYFDYRQLSNLKIEKLVELVQNIS